MYLNPIIFVCFKQLSISSLDSINRVQGRIQEFVQEGGGLKLFYFTGARWVLKNP